MPLNRLGVLFLFPTKFRYIDAYRVLQNLCNILLRQACNWTKGVSTNDLSVEQKYKASPNDNKVRWWFVLRGEEAT